MVIIQGYSGYFRYIDIIMYVYIDLLTLGLLYMGYSGYLRYIDIIMYVYRPVDPITNNNLRGTLSTKATPSNVLYIYIYTYTHTHTYIQTYKHERITIYTHINIFI